VQDTFVSAYHMLPVILMDLVDVPVSAILDDTICDVVDASPVIVDEITSTHSTFINVIDFISHK